LRADHAVVAHPVSVGSVPELHDRGRTGRAAPTGPRP
jgi:hypothetical protein